MTFVQRDEQGSIIGCFRNPQPGYAEEEVADDAQDVLDFLNPPPPAFPDLEPWRFWAVVNLTPGLGEDNLRAAISALSDATFKAIALAKLDNPPGGKFSRGDALFSNTDLQDALSMNSAAIDALWTTATELPA